MVLKPGLHEYELAVALLFSPSFHRRVLTFASAEGNLIGDDCGLLSRGISNAAFEDYLSALFRTQLAEFSDHDQFRLGQTNPQAMHQSARSLVRWSDSGELLLRFKRLTCRKCYIWGEKNGSMPVLRRLEGVATYMIPRSGHGMMTDNPEDFYSTLVDFIRS
jgi:pimeloyl-ACP methyl ester carboxylesterase